MNDKLLQAMGRGREYMLAAFANLPIPGHSKPAFLEAPCTEDSTHALSAMRAFQREFGELYPGATELDWVVHILQFRYQWRWKANQAATGPSRRGLTANTNLASNRRPHFAMDDPSAWATAFLRKRPLPIDVDFPTGKLTVVPETVLDWLVLSMIACRRNLSICANPGCQTPYFVKTHPRAIFCSLDCSAAGRARSQREWEKAKRPSKRKAR